VPAFSHRAKRGARNRRLSRTFGFIPDDPLLDYL
jgi:hypothetical protein